MRSPILAMTVTLALVAGQLQAAPPKSPPDVGPGRIAWFDLTTSDLARSREFYGKLFAWEFAPVRGTDLAPFNLPGGRGAIALALDPAGHPVAAYDPRSDTLSPALPSAGYCAV